MASVLSPHVWLSRRRLTAVNVPLGASSTAVNPPLGASSTCPKLFQPQQVMVVSVLSPHVWCPTGGDGGERSDRARRPARYQFHGPSR